MRLFLAHMLAIFLGGQSIESLIFIILLVWGLNEEPAPLLDIFQEEVSLQMGSQGECCTEELGPIGRGRVRVEREVKGEI